VSVNIRIALNPIDLSNATVDHWIGHSSDNGWVLLDRQLTANASGSGNVILYRLSDCKWFSIDRRVWIPPGYLFHLKYLDGLRGAALQEANAKLSNIRGHMYELLNACRTNYLASVTQDRDKLLADRRELVLKAHKSHFLQMGRPYPGTLFCRRPSGNRMAHCWKCGAHLESRIDVACMACHWMICGCGACGCGYPGPRE